MNLWHLIIIIFFFIFIIDSGKIQPNFDEIFGNGWDKNEREEKVIKIEQNEFAMIDQIDGENGIGPIDQQKREIIIKFDAIKEKLREKGKYKKKYQSKIELKIGKLLGANRRKIYKWKKELNLNKIETNKMKKSFYEEKKKEFIERIDEFKELSGQRKQKEFVRELGISEFTFIKWKKELMPNYHKKLNKYSNEDRLKKLKQYFEIKEKTSKISDKIIAKKLGITSRTLLIWKNKFA